MSCKERRTRKRPEYYAPVSPTQLLPADVSFTDLFDVAEIQRIQDAFAQATRVASIITCPDGTPITKPSRFCRLCKDIIRQTEQGHANCLYSDAVIGRQNPKGPIIQPCLSGGLWDAGASITVGGKHVANWLVGQVKNEAINEEKIIRYASEIGADQEEFRRALQEVPVMSIEQFRKVAEVLFMLANELSLKAYQNLQQARLIAERLEAADALEKAHAQLELRVEERTAELTETNKQLAQEIEERKQVENALRTAEQEKSLLLNSTLDLVVYHAADMTILWANHVAAESVNTTQEALKGKYCWQVWHQRSEPCVGCPVLLARNTGIPHTAEIASPDGRHWFIRGYPLKDDTGRLFGMAEFCLDITERKKTDKALLAAQEQLEQRVKQRTAELEHRTAQLAALAMELSMAEDRERRQLADVLHDDLQQILVSMQFHLGALARRVKGDNVAAETIESLSILLKSCVTKTRTLSHELSPPTLRQQGLIAALQWQGERMQTQHGLTVEIDAQPDAEPATEGLRPFLFKAVGELLFNIVKHAGVNQAHVKLRRAEGKLQLTIQDHGRGFNPDTVLAGEVGHGFGLLGIRERLGLLGGRLDVHSTPGQGSTFVLLVPDAPWAKKTQSNTPTSTGSNAQSPLRVLLADDHWSVREGLVRLLESEPDIEVVGEADNGRQVVDLTQKLHPDVIVMDISMPLMNGIDATRLIKQQYPHVRVVALSMFEQKDAAQNMYQAGVDIYLAKRGPAQELLNAIRGRPR